MEELMARRKLPNESMARYYHSKLELCERCGIKGGPAVSLLIRGLPEHLRANACALSTDDPEYLYSAFLAKMEGNRGSVAAKLETHQRQAQPKQQTRQQTDTDPREASKKVRCYNCQELGDHLSRDCPKPRRDRCRTCGRTGHLMTNCTYAKDGAAKPSMTTAPGGANAQVKKGHSVSTVLLDQFKRWGTTPNGERVKVYIDTGSKHNILAYDRAKSLGVFVEPKTLHLHGFGGGVATAVGTTRFKLLLDGFTLDIKALVTRSDLDRAELVLGQPALEDYGLMAVGGKAVLTTRDQIDDLMKDLTLEEDNTRRRVVLAHDIVIPPDETMMANVKIEGAALNESVYMGAKVFEEGACLAAIPSGVILNSPTAAISITNLGSEDLKWKEGRLIARAELADQLPQATPPLEVMQVSASSLDTSNLKHGDINDTEKAELIKLIERFGGCFSLGEDDLGLTDLGQMKITLTSDKPVFYRPYRLSFAEREIVRDKVQTLLDAGAIRESDSDFASPIILVPKKTGGWRMCVDYRALNANTVKDKYPLPLITDQIDRLAGKRYFTTLDLAQGYHQVPMDPDSVGKTAFITPDGHYEYLRVPFGLANAPAVFQRVIDKMLGKLRHDRVLAYMDDLLIPSVSVAEGLELLGAVLGAVERAHLKLRLEKCSFLEQHLEYLGQEISAKGVRPGRRKIKAVTDFPTPQNVHGVRQFIGLASYFRRFIKGFSLLAKPLTDLTKQAVDWRWGEVEQASFDKLKQVLAERPVLAIYDSGAPIEVHTDASKWGIGGILLQQFGGQWRPVAYYSRSTTITEQAYHSYELETMALVESVKRFRVYLVGVHFRAVTDCAAVRATMMKRDMIPRIARWWIEIQGYDIDIVYRPGGRMQHVDALSRSPVDVGLVRLAEADWFLAVQLQDEKARHLVDMLSSDGVVDKQVRATYKLQAGRLYRKTLSGDRLYVPAFAKFSLLRKHHDDIGHPGVERCLELLRRVYWFPKMGRFVRKYVSACLNCAFGKGKYGKGEGFLHPIRKRPVPMDTVHVDHLGPFMRSTKKNAYILMVVDAFTKFVWAKPTRTLRSVEVVEKLQDVFCQFGYPRRVIHDIGRAFDSKVFLDYLASKGIRNVPNAVATPRANGQVERPNRTMVEALTTMTESEANWESSLPGVIWGMNNTVNAGTKFSPAQLMFSHENGAVADLAGEPITNVGLPGVGSHRGVVDSGTRGTDSVGTVDEGMANACQPCVLGDDQERSTCARAGGEANEDHDSVSDLSTDPSGSGQKAGRGGGEIASKAQTIGRGEWTGRLRSRRRKAAAQLEKTAKAMKVQYDKRRKTAVRYKVGDLVLWRNASTTLADKGVNRKLSNKYDGPYKVIRSLGHDRYVIVSLKGARGYKKFRAVVAADSLKPFGHFTGAKLESDDSTETSGDSDTQ